MSFPFLLFIVLLILGLSWGEVDPKAAGIYIFLWLSCLAIAWMLRERFGYLWLVVPTVLFDALLILRVFGKDPEVPHHYLGF